MGLCKFKIFQPSSALNSLCTEGTEFHYPGAALNDFSLSTSVRLISFLQGSGRALIYYRVCISLEDQVYWACICVIVFLSYAVALTFAVDGAFKSNYCVVIYSKH